MVGFPVNEPDSAAQAADVFYEARGGNCDRETGVGGAVCYLWRERNTFLVPAFPVLAVYRWQPGCTFNGGGLATTLASGLPLRRSFEEQLQVPWHPRK